MLSSACLNAFSPCDNESVTIRINMLMSACSTNKNPVSRPQWHKQCIYGLDTYWGLVKNTSKWRHWLPFLGNQINKLGNWHILHMFSSCILSVPSLFIVFIPLPFIGVCPRLVYCIVSSPPFKVSSVHPFCIVSVPSYKVPVPSCLLSFPFLYSFRFPLVKCPYPLLKCRSPPLQSFIESVSPLEYYPSPPCIVSCLLADLNICPYYPTKLTQIELIFEECIRDSYWGL